MLQKTIGIVLHTFKYNDTSNIVDIFTRDKGRVSFIVRIPKSNKSTVKKNIFQPLNILEIEADFRDKVSLSKIKNAKPDYPFVSITYDPYKITIALFLSEFLHKAINEGSDNEQLFDYIKNSIIWLDQCEKGFSNFHLVFLMRV